MNPSDPLFTDREQSPETPAACANCGGPRERLAVGVQCVRCLFVLALGDGEGADDPAWRFGDFEVSRQEDGRRWELGRGAMGVTYRAQDTLLDRPVALKVVGGEGADQNGHRTRFLHEARRAAALRHPNVAGIFQYGVRDADGQPFYAMEWVEGETLEQRVRRTGPLSAPLALQIVLQIARALQAAEKRGIVHRDLKPANVMLAHGPEGGGTEPLVKVIDFGLAQVASAVADPHQEAPMKTGKTRFAGTPAYASPEQLAGDVPLDIRADFHALGATLWFLLSGDNLFGGLKPGEIRRRQTDAPLPFARLPNAPAEKKPLIKLLRRLLAPDRAHRPQTGDELVGTIQDCQRALASGIARLRGYRLAAAGLAVLLAAATLVFLKDRTRSHVPGAAIPRTLAVLPFDNLSPDQADDFLADGVRKEVADSLARYAGLKVLSPPGIDHRLQSGSTPGAAYVMAGSVKREAKSGTLQVQVSLSDARTGVQDWSATYDRASSDLFALQGEIAAAVAQRLGLPDASQTLPPSLRPHVPDPTAYEMYLRAWAEANRAHGENIDMHRRILHWLHEATDRDPGFAAAYTETAFREALIYWRGYDPSPAQAERVRAAADQATSLGADTAESHNAQGVYHYYVRRDYERAGQEFAAALREVPTDDRALFYLGLVERRQGHWEAALQHFQQAETLAPLRADHSRKVAETLAGLHRYGEIEAEIEAWKRRDPQGVVLRAHFLCFQAGGTADTGLLRQAADLLPTSTQGDTDEVGMRYSLALLDHDPAEALRVLTRAGSSLPFDIAGQRRPKGLLAAQPLLLLGDGEAARRGLLEARPEFAQAVPNSANPPASEMVLARLDALLGRRQEALQEGSDALAQCSPEKDAFDGPVLARQYAAILALVGDRQGALDRVGALATRPNGPSLLDLSLHPDWDSLRGDPRFEAVRSAAAVSF